MKALQIVKYDEIKDGLSINKIKKPAVKANDILVEVKAAGLNPIDYKIVEGQLKGMISLNLPCTISFDVSGVVVEKGIDVNNFEIGDEVYSRVPQEQMGTVAEFVAINSDFVAKKPDNISFEKAAGLPLVGLTAIQALERVGLKENDRILIHAGSGGVGSFAIQYAKAKGAIVYTTTSTKNVDWVKALGADRVIDYKTEDYKEVATNLDIVFDTLGDNYTFDAFQIIKEGGKVTTIVGPPDEETAKQMGMTNYTLPEKLSKLIDEKSADYELTWMQPNAKQLKEIATMVEDRAIKPIVDFIYSLENGIDAYEYLASGKAEGKVIISLSLN
ncbi:alcohol dehydrogenase and quinone reductase-like medium chain degydrogenase/reductase, MDR superfamily [Psychroflexus torquis ATCC 700755]|uniref:Alcohol dehydrogenase and quinone reductase-like medium chain degydrogenase/reductase, MDR superfamily n=1 Tax=Psychroflexus torquis (strain ATCC 700755 / CIP 106069 / ACAM 623) TaxID=313595 RepID=K4IJX3_PSYTT|nr:NADP-dependent oxidoreductase [Psychroflexus torquis]AFU69401.1 alcohol dehydrogenase and quinone reductase-like medium chain degydrogenase/reductase, MDR superfamily [Psychroflexus torquis ATCC 700755]